MKSLTIIVACGTSVATSTVVKMKLQEAFEEIGITINTINSSAIDVDGYVKQYSPDMIVATCDVSQDYGIPFYSGIPFLTSIGEKELLAEIIERGTEILSNRS